MGEVTTHDLKLRRTTLRLNWFVAAAMVIGIAGSIQEPDARHRLNRRRQCLNGGGIPALAEIGNTLNDLWHQRAIR